MDADAELDLLFGDEVAVARCHAALDVERTAHGVHHAGELDQNAVSGGVKDAAAIGLDRRVNQLGAERAQTAHRPFLVCAGQPRITRDIGGKNGRQLALDPLRCHARSPGR